MATNLIEHFNIKTLELKKGYTVITVDIKESMHQPYQQLHGGINAVLVETAASIGGNYLLKEGYAVGVEVNVNHLKSKQFGTLFATGQARHVGRSVQVWEVDITDERERLIAVGRITLKNVKSDRN